MFLIARTATYVTVFVGLGFIWLPSTILTASRIEYPTSIGFAQAIGAALTSAGTVLALWSILMFLLLGKGTPAPFDPPRRLVVSGPYRFTRNPMYIGGLTAVIGAALFYESYAVLAYAVALVPLAYMFVIGYEEPDLRRRFPHQYPVYCGKVKRWGGRLGLLRP